MDDVDSHPHWEDAIDIDDSDLPSLLHPINPSPLLLSNDSFPKSLPSLFPCSQSRLRNPSSPRPPPPSQSDLACGQGRLSPPKRTALRPLIPGPAGAVQAAMHRRSSVAVGSPLFDSQGKEVGRRSRLYEEVEVEDDVDFKLNPWLCAIAFLGGDFDLKWPIGSIKSWKGTRAVDRIPQVAGVVKSCLPNGLGDLFVTLKDPSGIIGASIHRNVLIENNLHGDLSVGCVLILKQVAIFCPGHSTCYLNITTNNMVKLIRKDCGPPDKQMMPSPEARYSPPRKQINIGRGIAKKPTYLMQSKEISACNGAGRGMTKNNQTNCSQTDSVGGFPCNDAARDVNLASNSNFRTNITANSDGSVNSPTNMIEKPELRTSNAAMNFVSKRDASNMMASKSDSGTINMAHTTACMAAQPALGNMEPPKVISSVPVAQWTDEQLLELFADYQDDADIIHHTI